MPEAAPSPWGAARPGGSAHRGVLMAALRLAGKSPIRTLSLQREILIMLCIYIVSFISESLAELLT